MMSKEEFSRGQCLLLVNTIQLADAIAAGKKDLRALGAQECHQFGEEFAKASEILRLCEITAIRTGELPAVVGLYERFAGYFRRLAEKSLTMGGRFPNADEASARCDAIGECMREHVRQFEVDAVVLFDAAMQIAADRERKRASSERDTA